MGRDLLSFESTSFRTGEICVICLLFYICDNKGGKCAACRVLYDIHVIYFERMFVTKTSFAILSPVE